MSEFEDELGSLAFETIDEFGKSVTYQNLVIGAYNPATGKATKVLGFEVTLKAIVEDLTKPITASLVEAGDKKLTIAALAMSKPQGGDKFVFDNNQYTVVEGGVNTTFSGEQACLYEVQVR